MNAARKYQRGASLWMILLIAGILGFGAIFGLKLVPMYLEWWKVEKAVAGAMQAGVEGESTRAITTAIVRRLDIDGVYRMTEKNLKEFMTIKKRNSSVVVTIDYEARDVLFSNVFLVAHFEKTVTN